MLITNMKKNNRIPPLRSSSSLSDFNTQQKKPSKRMEILHCQRHESNWMITLKKCVESKVLPKEDKMLFYNKKNLRFFFHFHTGIINNSSVVSI